MSGREPGKPISFLLRSGLLLLCSALLAAVLMMLVRGWTTLKWSRSPQGATVTYYAGTAFEKELCRRPARRLVRDYGRGRPAFGVPRNGFSARWEAFLEVPERGEYRFFSQSDDGLRLFIDDRPVIDNWRDQVWPQSGKHGRMHLTAGSHRLRVEHYDRTGPAALRIRWTGGPVPPNTVIGIPYLVKR